MTETVAVRDESGSEYLYCIFKNGKYGLLDKDQAQSLKLPRGPANGASLPHTRIKLICPHVSVHELPCAVCSGLNVTGLN